MPIQIPTSGNNPTTTTPSQQTDTPQSIVESTEQGQSQTSPVTEQPQLANSQKRLDGVVYIVDENVPIIVLYGPTSCGKSMTLVRMTNYLRSLGGYAVTPDRTFRPSDDKDYQTDCDNFDAFVQGLKDRGLEKKIKHDSRTWQVSRTYLLQSARIL